MRRLRFRTVDSARMRPVEGREPLTGRLWKRILTPVRKMSTHRKRGTVSAMNAVLPTTPRFPFPRELPFDPPPLYAAARGEKPIFPVTLWNGQRAWLLLRHDDLRSVMTDPRFSGEFARADFTAVTEARV